jgi:phosphatidylinositol alpha-mannosyltransferase
VRIALVHPFHWEDVPRGGERYLADLARYLVGAGHDVTVVVGGEPSVVVEDGLRVVRVRHLLPERIRARGTNVVDTFGFSCFGALRERFDLVHALVPSAAVAARLRRQRVLLTAMGHPTLDQFGERPLELTLARAGVRAAHCVAAFSDASGRAVEELFGRSAVTLPLGVHITQFPVAAAPRTGPVRLLFAGTPALRRKGIDTLLRAMPAVLDVHPEARLLLPGEPLEWDAASARTRAAVDVLGVLPMEQMPALYRSATVSVLPARHEALGISLVESLASGTPVVGGADAGILGIITDDAIGRLAPPGDEIALAAAVLQTIDLARTPGTAARCAEHALAWDWERTLGPLHEQVYERLVRTVR